MIISCICGFEVLKTLPTISLSLSLLYLILGPAPPQLQALILVRETNRGAGGRRG